MRSGSVIVDLIVLGVVVFAALILAFTVSKNTRQKKLTLYSYAFVSFIAYLALVLVVGAALTGNFAALWIWLILIAYAAFSLLRARGAGRRR